MKTWNVAVVLIVCGLALAAAVDVPQEMLLAQQENGAEVDVRRHGPRAYSLSVARLPNDARCQNKSRSCRDCNAVNECAYLGGSYQFNTYTTCPEHTPYCNDGQCTTKPASDNCLLPSISYDFKCFADSDGYFPAPADCRKYYICLQGDAYEYKCPEGHVYDHRAAMCVRQTSQSQCFTFECSGHFGEYLLYAPDETVYAYCRNTWTPNAWVFRCPRNYRVRPDYQSNTASCEVYCQDVGRIQDPENSRRYWECRRVGNKVSLEPVLQTCPRGMLYDDSIQRCVVDKNDFGPEVTPEP